MIKKELSTITVEATWKIDSPIILKANAFRAVYTRHSTVLYFGILDPEDMLPKSQSVTKKEDSKTGKITKEIKTLARYSLDHDELLRLKTEIDKTIDGLKRAGVLT